VSCRRPKIDRFRSDSQQALCMKRYIIPQEHGIFLVISNHFNKYPIRSFTFVQGVYNGLKVQVKSVLSYFGRNKVVLLSGWIRSCFRVPNGLRTRLWWHGGAYRGDDTWYNIQTIASFSSSSSRTTQKSYQKFSASVPYLAG
jgi:hypothetical protein